MSYCILCKILLLFCHLVLSSNVESNESDGSSLVFVFDTTGSMFDDLVQLREGAELILDEALKSGNAINNFVFVPFHDPGKIKSNKNLYYIIYYFEK